MPMYHEMNSGYDDSASLELSEDCWGIYKATSLLSDSVSFYDDSELFGNTGFGFNQVYELPPKIVKTEPMADLLPDDGQRHGDWQYKSIEKWLSYDCLFWFIQQMQELKAGHYLTDAKMEKFIHTDGTVLKQMTEDDFTTVCPEYGMELFNRLQKVKLNTNSSLYNSFYSLDNTPLPAVDHFSTFHSPTEDSHKLTDLDSETQLPPILPYLSSSETDSSGYKSDSSLESPAIEPTPPPEKRRPGRPRGTRRKKKPEKLGRLWEFIRDLLLDARYNPSLICWEDYKEGMFRFVHSDRVAKLWGSKKDNIDMNYEKLSRAMRYYYKSEVLLPVYGKRLVYKFGPKAMDGIRNNISNSEARSLTSST